MEGNSRLIENRTVEAAKQLFCGGIAGSVAKTITAPLSRLTILFQVHSMVTTKHDRPKFSMTLKGGFNKIVERGGLRSLWRGNMTSVLHRFPYSAINFFVYENTLDILTGMKVDHNEKVETVGNLARRITARIIPKDGEGGAEEYYEQHRQQQQQQHQPSYSEDNTSASHKFLAGAVAGSVAVSACYPLDLVRTRLTTQLEGHEHYRGIRDAFRKIYQTEGLLGFYSGIAPTMLVAVPNFAISYSVYGTLKEYTLDDELFYNLRRIDADSGEPKLGFFLTVLCGACSGFVATSLTFPFDTIRRRMQIQNLHVDPEHRLSSAEQLTRLVRNEGLSSLYRGLTPEMLKVVPMVGTMFMVYEWSKDVLDVKHNR
ncbi:mitochondrial carrier protein [Nitzschia inconspicua]|uniref:Mitochondrial carrier protein n=1 Tax=Nitzschia inconspicua TaxID=303405 RepID=A0A9K3PG82_9STRA|nr:mitochondrial carrier protein [Nitzschia inconspicua]